MNILFTPVALVGESKLHAAETADTKEGGSPMKNFTTVFASILISATAYGQQVTGVPPGVSPSQSDSTLNDVLNLPQAMPLGPYDLLQEYESQMAAISDNLGEELLKVLVAVQNGELEPDMADYISEHNYELAMMQFRLLTVLHADLAKSITNAGNNPGDRKPANDALPPGSSTALRRAKAQTQHINRNTSAANRGSTQ